MKSLATAIEPRKLDLCQLAYLTGLLGNEQALAALHAAGFSELRPSHGFIFQHLLGGPVTIGALAKALGVTQQAVSKSMLDLERAGYVRRSPGEDARQTRVELTRRGADAVRTARAVRRETDRRIAKAVGVRRLAAAKAVLAQALDLLGGTSAVRERRVRPDAAHARGDRPTQRRARRTAQNGSKQS